ncbi:hypothetical protein [Nannocystis sp. SCPEA4]|uniref:hypothetical protein n=1 Tax=Nannocystis sp. SCPEA4 TaxID=2996787 RepID=UPI00226EFF35|nr:hypothetical protein [Nannocystis sp. SCPEA4]MCY1054252.1 hypothetical protein [Nannocystis sp. SCPEA4]
MPPAVPRSCYIVELSVQPGGSRWAELHVYSEVQHVRACVDQFVANDDGLSTYHAVWYGATLGVWLVQRGEVVEFVDLEPHLSARIDGSEWVPLSQAQALVLAARPRDEDGDEEEEDDRLPADFEDCDLDAYGRMELRIDWEAVAACLPALESPQLRPGQRTTVTFRSKPEIGSYLDDGDEVRFGSWDLEGGDGLPPPFTIEGWQHDGDDDED